MAGIEHPQFLSNLPRFAKCGRFDVAAIAHVETESTDLDTGGQRTVGEHTQPVFAP